MAVRPRMGTLPPSRERDDGAQKRAHAAIWKQSAEAKNQESGPHSAVLGWTFRKGGLNTSLPRCVHPPPIKPVFYGSPKSPRLDAGFTLRCFQRLSLTAWLPSGALSDNW